MEPLLTVNEVRNWLLNNYTNIANYIIEKENGTITYQPMQPCHYSLIRPGGTVTRVHDRFMYTKKGNLEYDKSIYEFLCTSNESPYAALVSNITVLYMDNGFLPIGITIDIKKDTDWALVCNLCVALRFNVENSMKMASTGHRVLKAGGTPKEAWFAFLFFNGMVGEENGFFQADITGHWPLNDLYNPALVWCCKPKKSGYNNTHIPYGVQYNTIWGEKKHRVWKEILELSTGGGCSSNDPVLEYCIKFGFDESICVKSKKKLSFKTPQEYIEIVRNPKFKEIMEKYAKDLH